MERVTLVQQGYSSDDLNCLANRTLLSYLINRLPENQYRISILDVNEPESLQTKAEQVLEQEPDIIGVSCYIWNYSEMLKLCGIIKVLDPHVVVVAGGPMMMFDEADINDLFETYPFLDFIIQGEGEVALENLIKTPPDQRINLGKVIQGIPLQDMDLIGGPLFEQFPMESKIGMVLLETRRGCLWKCSFCTYFLERGKIREKSDELVYKELAWAQKFGYHRIWHLGAIFNENTEKLRRRVELMERAGVAKTIEHYVMIDHRLIKEEQIEFIKRVNVDCSIGLQSSNLDLMNQMNRPTNLKKFEQTITWFQEAEIPFSVDLLLGLPGDTVDSFKSSVKYLMDLGAKTNVNIFRVLPGSELYYNRNALKMEYSLEDYLIQRHHSMDKKDLWEAIDFLLDKNPDSLKFELGVYDREGSEEIHITDVVRAFQLESYVENLLQKNKPDRSENFKPASSIKKPIQPSVTTKQEAKTLVLFAKQLMKQVTTSKILESHIEFWGENPVVAAKVQLNTGETFTLALASKETETNALIETDHFKILLKEGVINRMSPNIDLFMKNLRRKCDSCEQEFFG